MKFAARYILGILAVGMLLMPPARAADGGAETPAPEPAPSPRIEILDFRDAPLRDALAVIGQASGLNLAASDEAAKTRVNIRLRNVSATGAVQAICQTHGLFFNRKPSQEGIDIVTTVREFQDGLTVFREEKTEVYTLLYPNAVDLAVSIRDLFGTRVQFNQNTDDGSDEISQRFSRFDVFDGRSQGLGVGGGGPYYVTGKDMAANTVFVTDNPTDLNLESGHFTLGQLHWIGRTPTASGTYQFRSRHRAELIGGRIDSDGNVTLVRPERAITAGQSVVIYDGEVVLGGGIIS